jgi:hypothetical protein
VGVPLTAIAAFTDYKFLTGFGKIGNRFFFDFVMGGMTRAVDNSSDGNFNSGGFRASAHFVFTFPMSTPL